MAEKEEKSNNGYAYISIVAIVAIVAVVMMMSGGSKTTTVTPSVSSSNLIGNTIYNQIYPQLTESEKNDIEKKNLLIEDVIGEERLELYVTEALFKLSEGDEMVFSYIYIDYLDCRKNGGSIFACASIAHFWHGPHYGYR